MPRYVLLLAPACLSTVVVPSGTGCQQIPEVAGASQGTGGGSAAKGSGGTGPEPASDPVVECDPGAPSCAPGAKCTVVFQDGVRNRYTCVPDEGATPEGEPCIVATDGVDGCAPGLACVLDRLEQGRCLGVCLEDGDCEAGECRPAPFDSIPYCARPCDPLAAECPPNMACRSESRTFSCQFPEEDDVGATGDACDPFSDRGCQAGLSCLAGILVPGCADAGCCTPYCNASDPGSAAACQEVFETPGVTCVPFFSGQAPGFEHVGVCMVPA